MNKGITKTMKIAVNSEFIFFFNILRFLGALQKLMLNKLNEHDKLNTANISSAKSLI